LCAILMLAADEILFPDVDERWSTVFGEIALRGLLLLLQLEMGSLWLPICLVYEVESVGIQFRFAVRPFFR